MTFPPTYFWPWDGAAAEPVPQECPRGHRVIFSTGECYTVREIEPGLYDYVRGVCEDLP